MKPTRYVLTGGLGNQLFQYAAALFFAEATGKKIELEILLGKPRGTDKVPDLLRFEMPNSKNYQTWSSLVNRALGYSLRISLQKEKQYLRQALSSLKKRSLSFLVSVILKRYVEVKSPSDLGFDESFNVDPNGDLVIGYFQSYRFASGHKNSRRALQELTLCGDVPAELENLRILALTEQPLIVHIRRGDYRQEDSFGLLSAGYYNSLIPSIYSKGDYNKIWLFSDDLPAALECIPSDLRSEVRPISEIDNSPAATLQAMRLGHGYIIANSSFSWWGAYLSNQPSAPVYAPIPWFKGMNSPKEILPPQWITHPSIWE